MTETVFSVSYRNVPWQGPKYTEPSKSETQYSLSPIAKKHAFKLFYSHYLNGTAIVIIVIVIIVIIIIIIIIIIIFIIIVIIIQVGRLFSANCVVNVVQEYRIAKPARSHTSHFIFFLFFTVNQDNNFTDSSRST